MLKRGAYYAAEVIADERRLSAKQYQVAKKEHYEVEDYVMVLHDEDDDDWVEI